MSDLLQLTLAVPNLGVAHEAFQALAFELDASGTILQIGSTQLLLEERRKPPHGLVSWTFAGHTDEQLRLDAAAVPPTYVRTEKPPAVVVNHANGVRGLDHVVVMVPALDPAIAGLEGHVGATCRRRTEMRGRLMAFLRAGDAVVELVEIRTQETPLLWGLAFEVGDIETTVQAISRAGGPVGAPQPAVQGGRIAASPPSACFGTSLAYLERSA